MRIVTSGNEHGPTQDKINEDQRTVRRFLASYGIDSAHVELLSLEVPDKRSNPFEGNATSARFAINATLVARTDQPERIRAASQDEGQLVAAGVALSSGGGWGTGPTDLFTKLNDLNPPMIAEATRSAREASLSAFAWTVGHTVLAHRGVVSRVRRPFPRVLGEL